MAADDNDLMPADAANPAGFYECRRLVDVNDMMLAVMGGDWANPPPAPTVDQIEQLAIAAHGYIGERFVAHRQWGMKDPRLVLTWPIWERAFIGVDVVKVVFFGRDGLSPGDG